MTDIRERFDRLGQDLDRSDMPDLWSAAHERRPTPAIPLIRKAGIVAFSLLVAIAGVGLGIFAFRGSGPTSTVGSQGPTPGVSVSDTFLSLWPQRSVDLGPGLLSYVGVAQKKADAGDPSATWQLSPVEVATRFASHVLGWSDPTVVGTPASNADGSVTVTVGQRFPCSPLETGSPSGLQGGCGATAAWVRHEITLAQPGITGTGGVWEVVEVHPTSTEFDLGVQRGQTLVSGQTLGFDFLDIPPGEVGLVASFDCAPPTVVTGTVQVDPNHSLGSLTVPDVAPHGECVGPSPNGYVYAYSSMPPSSSAQGDPFKATTPIGEIAIVPVTFTRTEQSVSATYTPRIGATIPVGPNGNTSAILYADGSVWVTASNVTGGGGKDRAMLFRIDPTKNLIVDSIPLAAVPSWTTGGGGLASGDGSIWVIGASASGAILQRVDPGSDKVVATIPLGGRSGADVAVDTSGVWAAISGDQHTEVVRVDPATNQVQARIQLPSNYVRRIVAADGGVLVEEYEWANYNGPCGFVTAIDPSTNSVSARVPVAPDCSTSGLWAWESQIWATTSSGFVRMDPATARPTGATTPYPTAPRGFVAPALDVIWYAAYPGGNGHRPDTLASFDPTTGISQEYDVQTGEVGKTGAITASAAPGVIWMLNYDGSVTPINLSAS